MAWWDQIQQDMGDTPDNLNWPGDSSSGYLGGSNGVPDWYQNPDNYQVPTGPDYGSSGYFGNIGNWGVPQPDLNSGGRLGGVDVIPLNTPPSPETDGPHDYYFYRDLDGGQYQSQGNQPAQQVPLYNSPFFGPPSYEDAGTTGLPDWQHFFSNGIWQTNNGYGYNYDPPPDIVRPPEKTI